MCKPRSASMKEIYKPLFGGGGVRCWVVPDSLIMIPVQNELCSCEKKKKSPGIKTSWQVASSWTKSWCFWKALNTSFRSLAVRKIKYRVKLIELERIWITCTDPLWCSFSRCTIPKLELNIDHLINIDLLMPCCLFVCFYTRILLHFLRLSSHPSCAALSIAGLQGGERWGTPQTNHHLI